MVLKISLGLFSLWLSIFNFTAAVGAQSNDRDGALAKTFNLSLPLTICSENPHDKISSFASASDNASNLFIAFQAGKIDKLNLKNGLIIWHSDFGGQIASDLLFDKERIYFVTKVFKMTTALNPTDADGEKQPMNYILRSIDAETGVTVWQFPFASNGSIFLSDYLDKLYLTQKNGTIISVGKLDAQKIFERNVGKEIALPPVFYKSEIYIGTLDASIYAISVDSGEPVSVVRTSQSSASALNVDDNRLYWGDKKGFVNFYDITKRVRVRQTRFGGEISSLTLVAQGILVSSLDNFVYLVSPRTGDNLWRRRLAGRISAKPLLAGDFVIFVTAADNNAVVVDLRSGRVVNRISLAEKGFILSTPLIIGSLLAFVTDKGIYTFAVKNADCTGK